MQANEIQMSKYAKYAGICNICKICKKTPKYAKIAYFMQMHILPVSSYHLPANEKLVCVCVRVIILLLVLLWCVLSEPHVMCTLAHYWQGGQVGGWDQTRDPMNKRYLQRQWRCLLLPHIASRSCFWSIRVKAVGDDQGQPPLTCIYLSTIYHLII